jgi:hypothetical protein
MPKTTFDIKSIDLPELPAAAARPLYAGVGVTDLAVEYVREAVADVQKRFVTVQKDVQTRVAGVQKNVKSFEFEPKSLRDQATTVVTARVDALTKDAKARRAAVEARVAELQSDAKAQAAKVQTAVNDNVTTVTATYAELAKRGETTFKRLRGEVAGALDEAADTVDAPKTATAKKSAARKSTAKKPAAKKSTTKKTTAKSTTE